MPVQFPIFPILHMKLIEIRHTIRINQQSAKFFILTPILTIENLQVKKTEVDVNTMEKDVIMQKNVLSGAEIEKLGRTGLELVGGKNYNLAILENLVGVNTAAFCAVSATAYNEHLDNANVDSVFLDQFVKKAIAEYGNQDLTQPKFVYKKGRECRKVHSEGIPEENAITIRQFINRKIAETKKTLAEKGNDEAALYDAKISLSIAAQIAILSVEMGEDIKGDIAAGYKDICDRSNIDDVDVAVRSSAVGEDSDDAAFAGAQDTYVYIYGTENVIEHVQRDFASGFNVRSLEYRISQINKAIEKARIKAKKAGVEFNEAATRERALRSFDFDNIAVSVVLHRMVHSTKAGTVFTVETNTGMEGVVQIDVNYGIGESVVGGLTTPDNILRGFDGKLRVITLGAKEIKIIRNEEGVGSHETETSLEERTSWVLSKEEEDEILRMAVIIHNRYGKYMDIEFAIDDSGIYMVQARPETNWNEVMELHPGIIPMRKKEVTDAAMKHAVKEGLIMKTADGASAGAATGQVKFIREINKEAFVNFKKGDILVAERTDPDFLPLMNIAGAIVANVGGRTSHAAITSRELNIPAVIGVGDLELLKSLDGREITVDGSNGHLIKGAVTLEEKGEDIDTNKIKNNLPTNTCVGLILADVNAAKKLSQLKNIPDFKVGLLRAEFVLGAIGVHYQALKAYDANIFDKLLELIKNGEIKEAMKALSEKNEVEKTEGELLLMSMYATGGANNGDNLVDVLEKTKTEIETRLQVAGYSSGHEFYTEMLSQQIALFAKAFDGKDIIYRTTDYKSNEYQGLLGGILFEPDEDNPMLGFRGVSRGIDAWEAEAFKKARDQYGAINLHIMLPFVRTEQELIETTASLQANGIERGDKGLKLFVMAEIPSVGQNPRSFLRDIDGFSIGSNDLTQGVLMTDRDLAKLQDVYDEEDPSVVQQMLAIIFEAIRQGKEVGFCGMGVSNSPFIAAFCAVAGITSASVTPDAYEKTKIGVNGIENSGISVKTLGSWMQKDKMAKMGTAIDMLVDKGVLNSQQAVPLKESAQAAYNWAKAALRDALRKGDKATELALTKATKPIVQALQDYTMLVASALKMYEPVDEADYDVFVQNTYKIHALYKDLVNEGIFAKETAYSITIHKINRLLELSDEDAALSAEDREMLVEMKKHIDAIIV